MADNKRLAISSLPKHYQNPFVDGAIEQINENVIRKKRFVKGTRGVEQTIVNRDGEITGHTAFLQLVEVDEDKFAKLYISQFAAFFELSKPAIRVFGYVLTQLIPNKDFVYVILEDVMEYTGYKSKNSIIEGLTLLCQAGILARSNTYLKYFINPLVVFNGDRVTFAKTYVRKHKNKGIDKSQLSLFPDNQSPQNQNIDER